VSRAAVKVGIFEDEDADKDDKDKEKEHVWISNIDFDGEGVTCCLVNKPLQIRSWQKGEHIGLVLDDIEDWIYIINGKAYGGHTVEVMRKDMSNAERAKDDKAWGCSFPEHGAVHLMPVSDTTAGLDQSSLTALEAVEHPMSESMRDKMKQMMASDASLATAPNDRGWTELHYQALAGNQMGVEVCMQFGADPLYKRGTRGKSALELAQLTRWPNVLRQLNTPPTERLTARRTRSTRALF
jgi:uncharacterized protein YegJ (DUF2314 family)